MLQIIDGRLTEVATEADAIDTWIKKVQESTEGNCIGLNELLIARKYASSAQLRQVDDLTISKIKRINVRKPSSEDSFNSRRALNIERNWLSKFADCEELPAEIRNAALAGLPETYPHDLY